jgi:catechol 2,3-dioxygenase-like lactoylglutathione lyase family enzyme
MLMLQRSSIMLCNRRRIPLKIQLMLALILAPVMPVLAQIAPPNELGVAMGQYRLVVRDVEAQRRVWTTLGGTTVRWGRLDMIHIPGVYMVLTQGEPKDGTVGSVVDHIGFTVKNLKSSVSKCEALGLKILPARNPIQSYCLGPEGIKFEFTEDPSLNGEIAHHHVHYMTTSIPEMQAWYEKIFGAKPGKRNNFDTGDIPGANLTYGRAQEKLPGTKGRSIESVGFEIKNLKQFCKRLETAGIKLDEQYHKVPHTSMFAASMTDPWGTLIELTEGLRAAPKPRTSPR